MRASQKGRAEVALSEGQSSALRVLLTGIQGLNNVMSRQAPGEPPTRLKRQPSRLEIGAGKLGNCGRRFTNSLLVQSVLYIIYLGFFQVLIASVRAKDEVYLTKYLIDNILEEPINTEDGLDNDFFSSIANVGDIDLFVNEVLLPALVQDEHMDESKKTPAELAQFMDNFDWSSGLLFKQTRVLPADPHYCGIKQVSAETSGMMRMPSCGSNPRRKQDRAPPAPGGTARWGERPPCAPNLLLVPRCRLVRGAALRGVHDGLASAAPHRPRGAGRAARLRHCASPPPRPLLPRDLDDRRVRSGALRQQAAVRLQLDAPRHAAGASVEVLHGRGARCQPGWSALRLHVRVVQHAPK